MKFRSKEVFEAVQWGGPGSPTPPGACEGIPHPAGFHSCDTFRNGTHVHGTEHGRLEFLKPRDWVRALGNEVFRVVSDDEMRASFEIVLEQPFAPDALDDAIARNGGVLLPIRRRKIPTPKEVEEAAPQTPSESLKEIDRIRAEEKAPNQE